MGQEDIEFDNRINTLSSQLQQLSWSSILSCSAYGLAGSSCTDLDYGGQLKLLMQAQALLTKNIYYQKVDVALRQLSHCQPAVYSNITRPSSVQQSLCTENDVINAAQRDMMVTNVRFLNLFYNYRHETFAHAVQLLDTLLGLVKVHPRFISSVGMCCFYIAAKANESPSVAPSPQDLVALSQCGLTVTDLLYTERLIYDTLAEDVIHGSVLATPLVFLRLFHQIVSVDLTLMSMDVIDLAVLTGKLEVIIGQFEFTRFRSDVVALALISAAIQDVTSVNGSAEAVAIAELQFYCQEASIILKGLIKGSCNQDQDRMNESEFWECRRLVIDYLAMYRRQPTKMPRLQLSWSVSRRTLHKMKPSTRAAQDLEPIMEDDDRNSAGEDSDTSSIFDSESDDIGPVEQEARSRADATGLTTAED